MKKALITGITGQDGAYLAEFLLSKDYEVHGVAVGNNESGKACKKPRRDMHYTKPCAHIHVLEECLGRKAVLEMLPMQERDVPAICADTTGLARDTGFDPTTPVETGAACFVEWHKEYTDLLIFRITPVASVRG